MTKPSKGAALFFICFGLMFLVPGLLSLYTFLVNSRNPGTSGAIVGAAIALFISAIGAGLVFVAFGGYRHLKKQAAIEEANPSSPWLWRTDWANRRAESQNKKTEVTAWVACIFCNLVMIPVAVTLIPQLARRNDPRVFLIVGFCLIGVILFVVALRSTLRHRRFGNTYFELDSLPFSPGGRLTGRIHLQLDSNASDGVNLRLSCIRKTATGSGEDRSTVQTVLWQTEQNVSFGAIGADPFGRTIPVDFGLPPDAYVTDKDNPSDQVLWLLHAQANIPGISYTDDFELPVFKTSSASDPLTGLLFLWKFRGLRRLLQRARCSARARAGESKSRDHFARRLHGILLSGFSQSLSRIFSSGFHCDLEWSGLFPVLFQSSQNFPCCVRTCRPALDLRFVQSLLRNRAHPRRQRPNHFQQTDPWYRDDATFLRL